MVVHIQKYAKICRNCLPVMSHAHPLWKCLIPNPKHLMPKCLVTRTGESAQNDVSIQNQSSTHALILFSSRSQTLSMVHVLYQQSGNGTNFVKKFIGKFTTSHMLEIQLKLLCWIYTCMYYAHVLQSYTGKHHSFLLVKHVYCEMQMAAHSKFFSTF